MVTSNQRLILASLVVVISAMCLEGLIGPTLYLNAERRGDTDTFDVSASFTALDENGTAMAGAAVRCTGSGGFSKSGTADSEGKWSFKETFTLASGDCPHKLVEMSCYAEKGSVRTTTASGSVELWCQSAVASGQTATPESTSTPTQACELGCKASGGIGGVCTSAGVLGPRCYDDVESTYKNQVNGAKGQVVSWLSSSVSASYKCEGETNQCFCYKLENCNEGCVTGKCVVPTACQAKGATGVAACATIGRACVSSTCGGGCPDAPAAEGPCGCIATCK